MNPYNLREGELSSGTTIMGVAYDGGVILGADSRTSTGSYVANRVSDKITQIHDYVWACRSGSAADTQAITDYVRYYIDAHSAELGREPRVHTVANLTRLIGYNNKDHMTAGLIVGGYDPYKGGQVFEIPLGGTLTQQPYAIGGSGSAYIYGLVDKWYKDGMTKEECKEMVVRAISHAMARDGSSGGVIRIVTIDQNGATKECIKGEELPYH